MFPHKTERGHAALQSHAGPLSLRERRMLILCDGRRGLDELTALFGGDAPALVLRLAEQGFLHAGAPKAAPPASATAMASPAPAPAANPRRSLVAAKMYMIGMLELQRSEEALARRLELQTSREPPQVVACLLASLDFLQRQTNPSMAHRVFQRLQEALPEEYLHALDSRQEQPST